MQRSRASLRVWRLVVVAIALIVTTAPSAVGRTGNFLIITASDYYDSAPLNQLVAAKASQGLDVMVQSVPSGTSRATIKTYIESLWGTENAPDYVLLVGDTDGSTAGSNTIPHWTGGGTKAATTDLPYGCMDGGDDWQPEIPVGRFSVRSVSMLQDVVDKTLCIESGAYPDPYYVKRIAFLASSDTGSGAEETHDWVIENYIEPAEYEPNRIYANSGGGTADITAALNNGTLIMVYFGHSSSGGWWTPAFDQGDIQALSNDRLYGLVFGFSCSTSHYEYDECFGETWLRAPDKGAAAYISASTFIYYGGSQWESSRRLEKYFFESFFVDEIWEVGPAWQAGMYRLIADPYFSTEVKRNMAEMFVLLGDPSLLLPQPNGFSLDPGPESQDLCSPPADEAVYTIEVVQLGSFAESVTLSASGTPPGASVAFDVNSQPPPFTSVMTVGNIIGGSPGSYEIEITGTATSFQRTVFVELNLTDVAPGPVTLSSPPNGAPDVPRKPTLAWQDVSQAVDYDLQIATDANFLNVVYSATVSSPTHMVENNLQSDTLHYWHVRANNGCGTSGYSPAFTFTTIAQADYFTEQFSSGFDLENFTLAFIPDGSGDHYLVCGEDITEFPTDPGGGSAIPLTDDDYEPLNLSGGKTVVLYGLTYSGFYVGSNGYITFGSGDTTYNESLGVHFNRPRISALFDDLNPSAGGTVSWKQLEDRAVVTYQNVPEYQNTGSNTFQIEMYFDGEIHVSWLAVDSNDSIVGLSAGDGTPDDYIESDLSASGPCPTVPGDLDGDGDVDLDDYSVFANCLAGPDVTVAPPGCEPADFAGADLDGDSDVDLPDFSGFQLTFTGE